MRGTILLTLGLALGAAGCGPSATSLCSDQCDCEGCSEEEEADCVDDVEDAQKDAEDQGCGDQFSDYLSCYSDQFECRDSKVDADGCNSEGKSLNNCMDKHDD